MHGHGSMTVPQSGFAWIMQPNPPPSGMAFLSPAGWFSEVSGINITANGYGKFRLNLILHETQTAALMPIMAKIMKEYRRNVGLSSRMGNIVH